MILIGDNYNVSEVVSISCLEEIRTTIYNFKDRHSVAKKRNKGIELSKGQLLAFIDADCIADTRWLEFLVKLRYLPLNSFDIVYIDGSHKAKDVLADADSVGNC